MLFVAEYLYIVTGTNSA